MIDVTDAVMALVNRAKDAGEDKNVVGNAADDALKFSQAALNVAKARETMLVQPPAGDLNKLGGLSKTG